MEEIVEEEEVGVIDPVLHCWQCGKVLPPIGKRTRKRRRSCATCLDKRRQKHYKEDVHKMLGKRFREKLRRDYPDCLTQTFFVNNHLGTAVEFSKSLVERWEGRSVKSGETKDLSIVFVFPQENCNDLDPLDAVLLTSKEAMIFSRLRKSIERRDFFPSAVHEKITQLKAERKIKNQLD